MFMPVCLNVTDKKILFIGGGKVTFHKLKSVMKYSKNITIISPEISSDILKLDLTVIKDNYNSSYLDNAFIVYACTNNREVNDSIRGDCELRKILVNVCDSPEDCGFISPAIIKEDSLSIAVSSNGEAPGLSVKVRDAILNNVDVKGFIGGVTP